MKILTKTIAASAFGAALLAAAPASAQYYPYDYDRYRDRDDRVEEVVRGVGAVIGTVAAVTQGGYYGRPYGYGYGSNRGYNYGYDRGLDRHAVNACGYEAERRLRGRVDVRTVQQVGPNRVRVLGAVDSGGSRYGYGYGRRAFSCEVRANGRISRFRTHNYGW